MEQPSPARLYATVCGGLLALAGVAGFLVSTEFSDPGMTDEALGAFALNGWANLLHLVVGLAGLAAAGRASRPYALVAGLLFLALGVWGVLAPNGTELLTALPATRGDNLLNLALGVLGLGAWAAGRAPRRRPAGRGQKRERMPSAMPRSPEAR